MVAKGSISTNFAVRPNKKLSVFQVNGLKIFGWLGTHFFSEKYIILCILKGISPFKMHKIKYLPEIL